jgi:hypothetical protein
VENLKQGNHLAYLDVAGRMILKWILKKQNWILLSEGRDRCAAVVDTVQILRLYKIRGFFGVAKKRVVSQE